MFLIFARNSVRKPRNPGAPRISKEAAAEAGRKFNRRLARFKSTEGAKIGKKYGLLYELAYITFIGKFYEKHQSPTKFPNGTRAEMYNYAWEMYKESVQYWKKRGYKNKFE